jgi:hypothetical protein
MQGNEVERLPKQSRIMQLVPGKHVVCDCLWTMLESRHILCNILSRRYESDAERAAKGSLFGEVY